ncbi:MAG: CHASE2 domain-containing protein [Candidatus Rokuibacteriota bacterium]
MIPARVRSLINSHRGGIGAAIATVLLVYSGNIDWLENRSLAALFELRGPRAPKTPIVIVAIDETTFTELPGQWPYPRAFHAEVISRLAEFNPLVIGIDIIFDQPSGRGPADDEALGEAVKLAGNVILGAAPKLEDTETEGGQGGRQLVLKREVPNLPLPVIRKHAAYVAPVNLFQDEDSNVRRAPLHVLLGGKSEVAFDTAIYQVAAKAGLPVKPLPEQGNNFLINFRGPKRTFKWVSYYQVYRGGKEVDPSLFKDAIVLIGSTTSVLRDVFPTAFERGGDMPGVEIHANTIETLVLGNYIHEVPTVISTIFAVIAALIGSVLVVRLRALRAFLALLAFWVVLTICAFVGFMWRETWMHGMAGTVGLVLGYGATLVDNFIREQREKRRLSQFFSPEVLNEVVRYRDERSLSSKRRLITVMFSDLRGFTSMSEQLEPEQVGELLREYLTEMTEIVFKHGGTVDKYIGDCIMALYNAPLEDPNHAVNAVRTGLEFQERTLEVSARWEQKLGVKIRNGVGINTGDAVVGAMGSKQRLEYTAIGDTVNLAARLESITKEVGASVVISESTYAAVKGHFMTRELGEVTVKGKAKPVKIFAVLPGSIRKHPRAALEAAAELSVAGGGAPLRVTTVDIGEGGMALRGVPDEWEKGKLIQLRCEGGLLPRPLVAEGKIVWRRGDMAGIAFTTVEPDSQPMVAELLSKAEDASSEPDAPEPAGKER